MSGGLKQKALQQLARTQGEAAQAAVEKELVKIDATLKSETEYQALKAQLDLLEVVAFRIPKDAMKVLKEFLGRLATLEISYSQTGIPLERYKRIYNKDALIKEALIIVERVRYHMPEETLVIFFEYYLTGNEAIKKQVEHGLKALAQFNLDVFWGTALHQGIGAAPQKAIISKIHSLSAEQKEKLFSAIVALCQEMLSPTMEGTSWSYKTVTLRTGSIPAADELKEVRKQAISILIEMYRHAVEVSQKKSIIVALDQGMRTPRNVETGSEVLQMISSDTLYIGDFYKSLIANEDLQIIQKIEHDIYWLFFHRYNDEIGKAVMAVKAEIDKHAEYQIFKVLVGFEGIFEEDWKSKSNGGAVDGLFERIDAFRNKKLDEYAAVITLQNFSEWEARIVEYSQVKSNDLATFPFFVKFLERFGQLSPKLALQLLSNQSAKLQGFIIPIIKGVWGSANKADIQALVSRWVEEGKYLFYIARFFELCDEIDIGMLLKIKSYAEENEDRNLLAQVIITATSHYTDEQTRIIDELFIPAVKKLCALQEGGWIFRIWHSKRIASLFKKLESSDFSVILDSLTYLDEIDFHAETILSYIAVDHPELIFDFFGKRLARESEADGTYDAIPFDFHKLQEPLSKIPESALRIVSSWYVPTNYSSFIHRGAKLLKMTFPDFPERFEVALIEHLQKGDSNELMVVLAILRNYEGQPFLHGVCKEIVKAIPINDDKYLHQEVEVILENAGVVNGEFGFVEAYQRKKSEVISWLQDPSEEVKTFAEKYIANLDSLISTERARSEERIALSKFEWGVDSIDIEEEKR